MTAPNLSALAAYGRRTHRGECVVETVEPGGFNPGTGEHDPDVVTEVYAGSCKAWPAGGARVVEFGEGPTTLATYVVELDGPVAGIVPEARVRFTSSPDPALDGNEGRVLEAVKSDTVTNRRLMVEVTS